MISNDFLDKANIEWHEILTNAFHQMEQAYLDSLLTNDNWLPGKDKLLNAFSLPLIKTRYILLGESPYPRAESANGYAFYDASVNNLWSDKGLSKEVNRATSLRNFIKMLLYAKKDLTNDFSQAAIARIDKSQYVQTAEQLFNNLMESGILLLNATLVYSKGNVLMHAKKWQIFIQSLLSQLSEQHKEIKIIIFGNIAKKIISPLEIGLKAEHPYNLSFITNKDVVKFFKTLDLLHANQTK